ncbi:MAG: HAD family hydrolase [Clostridia bacterium]|nr:HAD family hydrolase [Clostridia bacterium]
MKYRLIAADIDGTLLNPKRELEQETVEAARKCMDRGAYFVLSSGRMPPALRPIAEKLGVNAPAVCYNGGAVVDLLKGETLYSTPVPLELARDIARECEKMGLYLHAFVHGSYIAPRYCELTEAYERLCGVKATVVNAPISEAMDEAPMKLLVLDTPEGAAKALPELNAKFKGRASLMHSQSHMIECVDVNTSKAGALEFLRKHLNVPKEETCAFGDGQNDIDMLMWAQYPYVMANAPESVKTHSPRFLAAPSNSDLGVARVLENELKAEREGNA